MKHAVMLLLSFMVSASLALAGSGPCALSGEKTRAAGDSTCGESCPAHGKDVVKTDKDVTLAGKIQCMHCDLHKADKCRKVLVTADKKIYQFCPDTIAEKDLAKLSGKEVKVKGTVLELKDAAPVIEVETLTAK